MIWLNIDLKDNQNAFYPRFSFTPSITQNGCFVFTVDDLADTLFIGGVRQKPQAPVRNRQTRKVTNAKVRVG